MTVYKNSILVNFIGLLCFVKIAKLLVSARRKGLINGQRDLFKSKECAVLNFKF